MESESPVWNMKNLRQVMNAPVPQDVDVTDFAATDNKQTLTDLNIRLKKHLNKVKSRKDIPTLKKEIEEAKKWKFEGYWNETDNIMKDIKQITNENANKLAEIQTTVLEKEEHSRKLEEETKLHKKLKEELKHLENTGLEQQNDSLNETINQLKVNLQNLESSHKTKVDQLFEKLKNNSENSNLTETVKNIRKKYENITVKNMKEINTWYNSRFQKAQEEEKQNLEQLNSKRLELKKLYKEKLDLKAKIETHRATIESLRKTQEETRQRVPGLKEKTDDLKKTLQALITQIDDYEKKNQSLLENTVSLKEQIKGYRSLLESSKEPGPDPSTNPKKNSKNDKKEKTKEPGVSENTQ